MHSDIRLAAFYIFPLNTPVKCSLAFKSTIHTNICNRISRIFQAITCVPQPKLLSNTKHFNVLVDDVFHVEE